MGSPSCLIGASPNPTMPTSSSHPLVDGSILYISVYCFGFSLYAMPQNALTPGHNVLGILAVVIGIVFCLRVYFAIFQTNPLNPGGPGTSTKYAIVDNNQSPVVKRIDRVVLAPNQPDDLQLGSRGGIIGRINLLS